jgi:hypothetical protein
MSLAVHSQGLIPSRSSATSARNLTPLALRSDQASPDAALGEQMKSTMKQQFAEQARDPAAFHELMAKVYGPGYDHTKAEELRHKALAGDFSWLPRVEFVDSQSMSGGNGAYDAKNGVVYLDRELAKRDPKLAASTYVEEAGHHLDTMLKTSDTQGDEGEMFRRLMAGEKLTAAQVQAIRSENDKGTITVNGKQVEVEFFIGKAFKAVGKGLKKAGEAVVDGAKKVGEAVVGGAKKAGEFVTDGAKAVGGTIGNLVGGAMNGAKKVGGAVVKGAKAVGKAVVGGAKAVGKAVGKTAKWFATGVKKVANGVANGVKAVAKGFTGALKKFGSGLVEMTVGFGKNLLKGDLGGALGSVVNGLDRAVFQSTQRFFSGVWDGAKATADGVTDMLGPLGKPLRSVTDRVHDIGHTALDTAFGIGRDAFRLIPDAATGFVGDVQKSFQHLFDGNFGDAAKQFGMAFVNVPTRIGGGMVDMGSRFLQGAASVTQTAVGAEPLALRFSDLPQNQQDYLKRIYGNSVDYDQLRIKLGGPLNKAMSPHAVGNTVYMPQNFDNRRMFDNGQLTADGLEVLAHELGHVWQNQNGGGDYIHRALGAQAGSKIDSGNAANAYDWVRGMNEGRSFRELNAEQQARLMEHVAIAAGPDGAITAADGMNMDNLRGGARNLTADEVTYLQRAWREIKAGNRVA